MANDADALAYCLRIGMTQIALGALAAGMPDVAVALTKGGVTSLTRNADGTVTVTALTKTWSPALTRNADGTVTVA